MPIPTKSDYEIAAIDDLHSVVLTRLRVWQRGGPHRDAKSVREALQEYADCVVSFVNDNTK
jgi:hypothetical protein